jgi:hypothetical protein
VTYERSLPTVKILSVFPVFVVHNYGLRLYCVFFSLLIVHVDRF